MGSRTSLHRWAVSVGAAVAAAALVAVVAVVVLQSEPTGEWADPPAPTPELTLLTPPVVLAAGDRAAITPTAAGVTAAIDELVRSGGLGERVSVQVTDVLTGETLYARRTGVPAVPASTIKIATSVAALAALGPAHQFPTTVVAGAAPGEVVLVGGGDPTLAIDEDGTYPGAARLDLLAEQVTAALDGGRIDRVTVDAEAFTGSVHGPWTSDIPGSGYVGPITALMTDGGRIDPSKVDTPTEHHAEPDLAAGRAFAGLVGASRETVGRGAAPVAPAAPGGEAWVPGAELGRVLSPPLLRLVDIVLTDSDNTVAEVLARQVALARGEPGSFAGAATAVSDVLAELGAPTTDAVFADGSGLSRDNRLTTELLTDLLVRAADPAQPALAAVTGGLPVAGWSGTLATRYREPQAGAGPGAGVVRAKTGTLTGIHSLAGTVSTADGRLLVLAMLADDVPLGMEEARTALDKVAAALAMCGCR